MIQITLTHVPGVELYLMLADVARSAKPGNRRATRVGRRDPPDLLVVPVHHPRALECPPSKSLDSNFNRSADWTFSWVHLERLAHIDPTLGEGHAVFREEHLVNAAIVFGNPEADRYPAIRVHLHLCQSPGCIGESLPTKVVILLDHPSSAHRSPDQIDLSIGRQPFSARFDLSACDELCVLGIRECELLQCAEVGFGAVGSLAARGEAIGCETSRPHASAFITQREQCDEETRDAYSTIVTWESSTTNGLNSPVRPYLSVAVTV